MKKLIFKRTYATIAKVNENKIYFFDRIIYNFYNNNFISKNIYYSIKCLDHINNNLLNNLNCQFPKIINKKPTHLNNPLGSSIMTFDKTAKRIGRKWEFYYNTSLKEYPITELKCNNKTIYLPIYSNILVKNDKIFESKQVSLLKKEEIVMIEGKIIDIDSNNEKFDEIKESDLIDEINFQTFPLESIEHNKFLSSVLYSFKRPYVCNGFIVT